MDGQRDGTIRDIWMKLEGQVGGQIDGWMDGWMARDIQMGDVCIDDGWIEGEMKGWADG